MFLECNGRFTPFDTAETIFLECIVQTCDSDNPRYHDLLGLPRTIYFRHPCRLSLGKLDHNRAQRSGWKCQKPTSLADYDIDLLNIIVETWTSNSAKGNFSPRFYPDILADFKLVNIPEKYYQRSDEATLNTIRQQEDLDRHDWRNEDNIEEVLDGDLESDEDEDEDEHEEDGRDKPTPRARGKQRARSRDTRASDAQTMTWTLAVWMHELHLLQQRSDGCLALKSPVIGIGM